MRSLCDRSSPGTYENRPLFALFFRRNTSIFRHLINRIVSGLNVFDLT
jgi:hypothetical protein